MPCSRLQESSQEERDLIIVYAITISLHILCLIGTIIFTIAFQYRKKKYKTSWYTCIRLISIYELLRDICYICCFASESVKAKGENFPLCPYIGYFNLGVIYAETYTACFGAYIMYQGMLSFSKIMSLTHAIRIKNAMIYGSIVVMIVFTIIPLVSHAFALPSIDGEITNKNNDVTKQICWFNIFMNNYGEDLRIKMVVKEILWLTLQWIIGIIIQVGFIIAAAVMKYKLVKKFRKNNENIFGVMDYDATIEFADDQLKTKKKVFSSGRKKDKKDPIIQKLIMESESDKSSIVTGTTSTSEKINLAKSINRMQKTSHYKEESKELRIMAYSFWFTPLIFIVIVAGATVADFLTDPNKVNLVGRAISFWFVSNGIYIPLIYVIPMVKVVKMTQFK